jgi:DnaK suppressor protein
VAAAPAKPVAAEPPPAPKPVVKPKWKAEDLRRLKEMLLQERRRIIEEMRILDDRSLTSTLDDSSGSQPGFSLQLADSASDNMQVETDLGIRNIEAEQLQMIDDALRAIDNGEYGICQRCQQLISIERLFAKPNAKYCVDCLRLLEAGKA